MSCVQKNWQKCIPAFLQNLKVFNSQIFCQLLKYLSLFLLSKHTQLKICIYPLSVFLLPLFWSHSYWPTSTGRNWHWCFFFKKERQQETLKKPVLSKSASIDYLKFPQQTLNKSWRLDRSTIQFWNFMAKGRVQ